MERLPIEYVKEEGIYACPYCTAVVEPDETECWNCHKPFAVSDEDFQDDPQDDWEDEPEEEHIRRRPAQKAGSNARGKATQGNLRGAGTRSGNNARAVGTRGGSRKNVSKASSRSKAVSKSRGRSSGGSGSIMNVLLAIMAVVMIGAIGFLVMTKIKANKAEQMYNAGMQTEYSTTVDPTVNPNLGATNDYVQLEQ